MALNSGARRVCWLFAYVAKDNYRHNSAGMAIEGLFDSLQE
ncbi:MAG: hypothetical protein QOI97_5220 [Pseudomonas sp.]|jgi:hypothetical protein|nr:hypothetical protein [Pseudomonas sp.]